MVKGPTTAFNPTIDETVIAKEIAKDVEAGRAEWDAEFRSDVSALLDEQVIEDAIDHARPLELSPRADHSYLAFADASAGRHDAFSVSIFHQDEETFVCDVVRGRLAPFDPRTVAEEYATLARAYGCTKITGDSFAGESVAAAFRDAGVRYETSPLRKSTYLEALPVFNRGSVRIPNYEPLLRELRGLERRVHRSGKDSVDHPRHGSDDLANAVCGALFMSFRETRKPKMRWGTCLGAGRINWKAPKEQHEPTNIRFVCVDESGKELTGEEAATMRHRLPGRRVEA